MAVRYEHTPAWSPYVPYSDGLRKSYEGLAAVRSPVGVSSLPQLAFSDLIDRVRVYESLMGFVPDSYLASLRSFVVYSDEFGVAIGGDSLADSVRSFRQRLSDPHDPVPGTSQEEDSIARFLYCLVALSPQSASSVADEHRGVGLASSGGWGFPTSSLPPSVATSTSLPLFSSAPSSFPTSISSSFYSGVFPSPAFPYPSPNAVPQAPIPPPLVSSLPFHPPFTSGFAPSTTSSFSFPNSAILPSPSSIHHSSFTPPLAPVTASSGASFLSPLSFVSPASSSSTAVSWSLPA